MNQTLTRYEAAPLAPIVTDEQLELVRRTVANGATDAELQLYLYDCQRHGVHPLDKLLHFTKRGGKYTPITSIDLLRSRAADTGDLAGIDDAQYRGEAGKADFTAAVTVYRMIQGQRCPFTATARWSEYKPADGQDHMWRKMPYLMLAKCAEALALRKAFPRQLAGLYASEEMDQAGNGGASYSAPAALQLAPVANKATGEVIEAPIGPPASDKQRNYITGLQDKIGWHSEQLAVYADQYHIDLVTMTASQASMLIESMKALAEEKPAKSGERALVKRLRDLIADCRGAGVAVPDLPKPRDMNDEQLLIAIQNLEREYSKAKSAVEDHSELFEELEQAGL